MNGIVPALSLALAFMFLFGCAAQQSQAPIQPPTAVSPQVSPSTQQLNISNQNSSAPAQRNEKEIVSTEEQIQDIMQYCQDAGGLWVLKAEADRYSIKIGIPLPLCQQYSDNCFDSAKLDELNYTCVNPKSDKEAIFGKEAIFRKQCLDAGYIFVPNEQAEKYSATMYLPDMPETYNETCVDPRTDKETVFRNQCLNSGYVFVPNSEASVYTIQMQVPCTGLTHCFDEYGNIVPPSFTLNETCVDPKSNKESAFTNDCLSQGYVFVPNEEAYLYNGIVRPGTNETCVNPNMDFRSVCIKMNYVFVPNAQASQYGMKFMPHCIDTPCIDNFGNVIGPYQYTLNETCVDPKTKSG